METGYKIMVGERYEILRQLNKYGETVLYLGYDKQNNKNVCLREFFTDSLMYRTDNNTIEARHGCEVKFKSLLMDYEELVSYQMNLPAGLPIIYPIDIVKANNTVYSVEEYIETETLDDFLAKKNGTVDWPQLKRMIAPLVKLLGKMHSDGIYHRGISPDTLLVTKDRTLILSGFCIPAARTAESEIESTLYFGYSAPEQYASNSWQGSWSDVYSLAAVCYRVLTGVTPVEWRQRGERKKLSAPISINKSIPKNVSDAIRKALKVELSNRYRTIEEFWCDLLLSSDGGTMTYNVPIIKRTDDEAVLNNKRIIDIIKQPLVSVLIALTFVSIFSITFAYKIAEEYILPKPQALQSAGLAINDPVNDKKAQEEISEMAMPSFIGVDIEKVLLDPVYKNFFDFQIEKIFSENYSIGEVVQQSPLPGQELETEQKQQTFLWVSKGSEIIVMPDLVGTSLDKAVQMLDMSDIGYDISFVPAESDDGQLVTGTVLETSISAGAIVHRSSDTVKIMVAEVIEKAEESMANSNEYIYVTPPRVVRYWPEYTVEE